MTKFNPSGTGYEVYIASHAIGAENNVARFLYGRYVQKRTAIKVAQEACDLVFFDDTSKGWVAVEVWENGKMLTNIGA